MQPEHRGVDIKLDITYVVLSPGVLLLQTKNHDRINVIIRLKELECKQYVTDLPIRDK